MVEVSQSDQFSEQFKVFQATSTMERSGLQLVLLHPHHLRPLQMVLWSSQAPELGTDLGKNQCPGFQSQEELGGSLEINGRRKDRTYFGHNVNLKCW